MFLTFFFIFSLTSDSFAGDAKQAVVVLPPAFPSGSMIEIEKEANHICDLLSEKLSQEGTLQVVNRTELKRLLDERKIATGKQKKIISYSAMIRLEVNTVQEKTVAVLRVIDLSSGSVLGSKTYGWKVKDETISKMKSLCLTAIKKAGVIEKGKVRVRALGVYAIGSEVRMKPFAHKLSIAFNFALGKSKKVMLMQHLEASNSMEESLLLLMGLSQLPGNRQFVPQADATIELRVKEGNGIGKTFQETPIIIGVRLADAKQKNNKWIETTGKVKEFDKLVTQAWNKLSKNFDTIEPGSTSVVLKEMQVRRKQAEAEYRAAINAFAKVKGNKTNIHTLKAIAHLDAALKIDPTFAEPLLRLSWVRGRKNSYLDAEAYVKHPQSDPQKWPIAMSNISYNLYWYHQNSFVIKPKKGFEKTENYRRLVFSLKFLVEQSLDPQVKIKTAWGIRRAVPAVARGMKNLKIPLKERTRWIDKTLKQLNRLTANTDTVEDWLRDVYLNNIRETIIAVAVIAIEDGQKQRARKMLIKVRTGVTPQKFIRFGWGSSLFLATQKLDDKKALKDLKKWMKEMRKTVGLIAVKWPQVNVWKSNSIKTSSQQKNPEVPAINIARIVQHGYDYQGISPIAVDDKRVYLMLSKQSRTLEWTYGTGSYYGLNSPKLASISLDKNGNPVGENIFIIDRRMQRKRLVWKPFHIHKQPPGITEYGKLFVQLREGKLYLGTQNNGLLIFNLQNDTWKSYGPKQGFPKKSVDSFFFLGNEIIYIAGGKYGAQSQHFTLNLRTNEIKVLHKANDAKREYYLTRLVPMWWDDGKLVGRMHIDLLSSHPKIRPDMKTNPLGSALDAAEIDGRRFFTTNKGLFEYNKHGEILHSWKEDSITHIGVNRHFSIPRIGKTPRRGFFMVKSGKLLVFFGREKGIVAFDPKTETWYGPLDNRNVHYAVGAKHGFWVAHYRSDKKYVINNGTVYIKSNDFIKTARKVKRVYTSQNYQKKLAQYIEKQPPLDQAKIAIMLRENTLALKTLNTILLTAPQNSEALFLRGLAQGRWGLNHSKEALKDYRALAKHSSSDAQITGLFFELMIHQRAKNYPEILRVSSLLINDYPNLQRRLHKNILWWKNHATKKLAKKKPKKTVEINKTDR